MSRSTYHDFIIEQRIGSGSFGVVYKVMRKIDRNYYAMKEIDLQGMSRKEQEECIRETRVLSSLDSDFIIKYYDSFLERGKLYIITEYAAKGNLLEYIKQHGGQRFPESMIWKLFCQILLGLNHMHRRKILHRDIKTLNVFLDHNSNVKLGDMGVAKIMSTQTCFAKTIVGTPYYLSPELCEDKPYNEKSDVWAMGVVMYECCLHRHPFDADNQGALILKILRGKYQPVTGYSPELCELVKKCLTLNASRRPSTYKLLLDPLIRQKILELGMSMPNKEALAAMHERTKSSEGSTVQPLATRQDQFNAGAAPAAHVIPRNSLSATQGPQQQKSQGQIRVMGDMERPPTVNLQDTLPSQQAAKMMNESKAFVFGGTPEARAPKPHLYGTSLRTTSQMPPSSTNQQALQQTRKPQPRDIQVSISGVASTSGELVAEVSDGGLTGTDPQTPTASHPPPLALEAHWNVSSQLAVSQSQQQGEANDGSPSGNQPRPASTGGATESAREMQGSSNEGSSNEELGAIQRAASVLQLGQGCGEVGASLMGEAVGGASVQSVPGATVKAGTSSQLPSARVHAASCGVTRPSSASKRTPMGLTNIKLSSNTTMPISASTTPPVRPSSAAKPCLKAPALISTTTNITSSKLRSSTGMAASSLARPSSSKCSPTSIIPNLGSGTIRSDSTNKSVTPRHQPQQNGTSPAYYPTSTQNSNTFTGPACLPGSRSKSRTHTTLLPPPTHPLTKTISLPACDSSTRTHTHASNATSILAPPTPPLGATATLQGSYQQPIVLRPPPAHQPHDQHGQQQQQQQQQQANGAQLHQQQQPMGMGARPDLGPDGGGSQSHGQVHEQPHEQELELGLGTLQLDWGGGFGMKVKGVAGLRNEEGIQREMDGELDGGEDEDEDEGEEDESQGLNPYWVVREPGDEEPGCRGVTRASHQRDHPRVLSVRCILLDGSCACGPVELPLCCCFLLVLPCLIGHFLHDCYHRLPCILTYCALNHTTGRLGLQEVLSDAEDLGGEGESDEGAEESEASRGEGGSWEEGSELREGESWEEEGRKQGVRGFDGRSRSYEEGEGESAAEGEEYSETEGEGEEDRYTDEEEDEYDDDFEDMGSEDGTEGSIVNGQDPRVPRRPRMRSSTGGAWLQHDNQARMQHIRSAALIQQAACVDLIGEKAFLELYTLLGSHQVTESSMTDLSRLVFKIIPYDKSEVIQMLYKLLYIESQLGA